MSVLGLPPWTDRAAGASAPSTSAAPAAGTLISEYFCELIRRQMSSTRDLTDLEGTWFGRNVVVAAGVT
jgi:hypothetical protein